MAWIQTMGTMLSPKTVNHKQPAHRNETNMQFETIINSPNRCSVLYWKHAACHQQYELLNSSWLGVNLKQWGGEHSKCTTVTNSEILDKLQSVNMKEGFKQQHGEVVPKRGLKRFYSV